MKRPLKILAQRSTLAQRLYRTYRRHQQHDTRFDWGPLLRQSSLWLDAKRSAASGPKVLLATSVGGIPTAPLMDSLLAVALTLRGAHVEFLLCDHSLAACLMSEVGLMTPRQLTHGGNQRFLCSTCYEPASELLAPLGLRVNRYSDVLASAPDLGQNIDLSEHARSGALRYFAAADLAASSSTARVLDAYASAAHTTTRVIDAMLERLNPDAVCCMNGIYVPHGVVFDRARARNIRAVAYNVAYRKRAFIFSHDDTYHHTLMSEPVETWETLELTEDVERATMEYLESRRRGGRDWVVFHSRNPIEAKNDVATELSTIDFNKPVIGLLTNVAWDAQLHYPANAFPSMMSWIHATLDHFITRPDLQLVIRIHPAEESGDIPSRQPVLQELRRRFPSLPPNIAVVPPGSRLSTYTLMEMCDSALVYGTKTGVELAARGIPVVVAGEAWIRNKGLTTDVSSPSEYEHALSRLPFGDRLDRRRISRARKYAYHFFFRRMIPVSAIEATGGEPQFRIGIQSLDALLPGVDPGLDVICDGILAGRPFVYPAEQYADALD